MTDFTTHFHIPYPEIGDGITSASMAAFANQVNSTLQDMRLQQLALTHRPLCQTQISQFTPTPITVANTDTDIAYNSTTYTNRTGFHDAFGAPTIFTIPESGVYYVSVFSEVTGADPLRTQIKVKKNGTTQFSTLSADPLAIGASTQYTRGMVVCSGGDILKATALVTSGTAPWSVNAGRFMIVKVSDM
jgi:hypothetical protein